MKKCAEGMVPFLTSDEIAGLVESIARDIKARHPNEHLHLICPLKGSIVFLTDLARQFDGSKVTIDFGLISGARF